MRATKPSLSIALSISLLAGLAPMPGLAQEPTPDIASRLTLTGQIAAAIEREGAALSGDPASVRDYVRSRISYEAYDGVLKGDVGTFLTGSGNGADQALLMASLIRAGDPSAVLRYATCTPDDEVAAVLVADAVAAADDQLLAIDQASEIRDRIEDEELRAAIDELVERHGQARADAARAADVLSGQLERAGYEPRTNPPAGPAEHVWQQVQVEGEWLDLETTTEDGRPRCKAEGTFDDLPESMDHLVRIGLSAEHRTGSSLLESRLLDAESRTPDLAAARIALAFGEPAGLIDPAGADGDLATYTPVLRVDGASLTGRSIELPRPSTSLGEGVGDVIADLSGLFDELPSGLEEDDDSGSLFGDMGPDESDGAAEELTALWLDIGLVSPGGEVIELRSELLDRIGIAARAEGMAGSIELEPLEEALGEYDVTSSLWQIGLLLGGVSAAEGAIMPVPDALSFDGFSAQLDALLRTFSATRRGLGGQPGAPIVLIAALTSSADGARGLVADLSLDALQVPAGAPVDPLEAARDAQAILAAEAFLASTLEDVPAGPDDAAAVFAAVEETATPLVYLRPGVDSSAISASPRALARMNARLGAGYGLLVPESAVDVDGVSVTAWWTIHPTTGLVRDEHENGRHSESTEYTIQTGQSLSTMDRFRRFGCRIARPLATATLILFLATSASPASPLWEPLSEWAEASAAAAEREAERKAAEQAACAL